jgi:hypothetical protein
MSKKLMFDQCGASRKKSGKKMRGYNPRYESDWCTIAFAARRWATIEQLEKGVEAGLIRTVWTKDDRQELLLLKEDIISYEDLLSWTR